MHTSTTRAIFCLWITLLAIAALAAASPFPAPGSAFAQVANNLGLGCTQHCGGAESAQQLNKNAALSSAVNPISVFGGIILASGVLAAV